MNTANPALRSRRRTQNWIRLIIGLVLIALALYSVWNPPQPEATVPADDPAGEVVPDRPVRERSSEAEPDLAKEKEDSSAETSVIPGQTIYDRDGDVVFEGDVDVTQTLARIGAGERLRFPNDGSTFQNRERRLPRQPSGYYKEYVHPTPGLAGPGPQRIVMGQHGETYYTPDHYQTFRRLDEP